MAINENNSDNNGIAITGTATGEGSTGVLGQGRAVGVLGQGGAVGVRGDGETWHGVAGVSKSTTGGAGVFGVNDTGAGVRGESSAKFNPAVHGIHKGEEGSGVQETSCKSLIQLLDYSLKQVRSCKCQRLN